MWEEGVRIYDTPRVPNNFPHLSSSHYGLVAASKITYLSLRGKLGMATGQIWVRYIRAYLKIIPVDTGTPKPNYHSYLIPTQISWQWIPSPDANLSLSLSLSFLF